MPRLKKTVSAETYAARTMAEVARELGVTPQRVSQLERSALAKLRAAFSELTLEEKFPEPNYQLALTRALSRHDREAWLWKTMMEDAGL